MREKLLLFAIAFGAGACSAPPAPERAASLRWTDWSADVFARARAEHRFVILDLEAVWCHWCHVMSETTYRDPAVVDLLQKNYICVRVDQDARPDLSNRYEDYGWPATIVFNENGGEVVKRSGYIPPGPMRSMLEAIIKDPTPGPSVVGAENVKIASDTTISRELWTQLIAGFENSYDSAHGGWGFSHKYLNPTNTEYAIAAGFDGDAAAEAKARQTLDAGLALLDPAWGGIYQYSTGGVWTEPHFEKIASVQSENLRIYSLAYAAWKSQKHLDAARAIQKYIHNFLTGPDGAFYTSQDADLVQGEHSGEYFALDDAGRRARGIPRVDKHIYSRENGWFIRALCQFYSCTGDERALADAKRAADWILKFRMLKNGGFSHDAADPFGPYLGDTLAMGQAFLALYESTADTAWLDCAVDASRFMNEQFAGDAGYRTVANSSDDNKTNIAPQPPQRDENLNIVRFENLLWRHTGDSVHGERAKRAMRWLASPAIAGQFPTAAALLAERELGADPLHITIVGSKRDAAARQLYRTALAGFSTYRRVEWYDRAEGGLRNKDIEYPELDRAAAFVCSTHRCSSPIFGVDELAKKIVLSRSR
ncbi:MAG: thioredoxin domain-containing protein [Planctomycetes bacterium]|nr:thioredoxin domain-containing protein [Planctomycetota bacterium]